MPGMPRDYLLAHTVRKTPDEMVLPQRALDAIRRDFSEWADAGTRILGIPVDIDAEEETVEGGIIHVRVKKTEEGGVFIGFPITLLGTLNVLSHVLASGIDLDSARVEPPPQNDLERVIRAVRRQVEHSDTLAEGRKPLVAPPNSVFWQPLLSGKERFEWLRDIVKGMRPHQTIDRAVLFATTYALLFATSHELMHVARGHFDLTGSFLRGVLPFPAELDADNGAIELLANHVLDVKQTEMHGEPAIQAMRGIYWGIYLLLSLCNLREATGLSNVDNGKGDLSRYPPVALRWRIIKLGLFDLLLRDSLFETEGARLMRRIIAAGDTLKLEGVLSLGGLVADEALLDKTYVTWALDVMDDFNDLRAELLEKRT